MELEARTLKLRSHCILTTFGDDLLSGAESTCEWDNGDSTCKKKATTGGTDANMGTSDCTEFLDMGTCDAESACQWDGAACKKKSSAVPTSGCVSAKCSCNYHYALY